MYMLPQTDIVKASTATSTYRWQSLTPRRTRARHPRLADLSSTRRRGHHLPGQHAAACLTRLDRLDATVASTIASIPKSGAKCVCYQRRGAYLANILRACVAGCWRPTPSNRLMAARRPYQAQAARIRLLGDSRGVPRASLARAAPPCAPPPPTRASTSALCGDTLDDQARTTTSDACNTTPARWRCLGGGEALHERSFLLYFRSRRRLRQDDRRLCAQGGGPLPRESPHAER